MQPATAPPAYPPETDLLSHLVEALATVTDAREMASTVLALFQAALQPTRLILYQADALRRILRPLATLPEAETPVTLSYDSPVWAARASRERLPVLISAGSAFTSAQTEQRADPEQSSGFCLPFWTGNTFEGCLLAIFSTSFTPSRALIRTLTNCGLYLATAFANVRLQSAVAEERTRQRLILDQLPEGILMTEASSGSISYANRVAAQVLDISLEQLVGSILSVSTQATHQLSADTWPRFPWTFAVIRALSGEVVNQMEAVVVRAHGEPVPVLCSSAPLHDEQGMITEAILLFQDITEQKHLEAQKHQFFSFASHELRTPLTTIMGYAELLREITAPDRQKQPDLPTLHLAAEHICVQTEQMVYLIDEMLDLARLDQRQLVLNVAPFDLWPITRRVVEKLSYTTHRHQFRLIWEEQASLETPPPVLVQADMPRLAQVLTALVNNAIKYSPEGGEIEVGIRKHAPLSTHALLWIKDHGLGIAPTDLPSIFTRFYRARDLDSAISGLGIGLYLLKNLIELHGGQVWVESSKGQGSTFFLSLPLAPAQEKSA